MLDAAPRQLVAGGQPGLAGTDDDDVHAVGHPAMLARIKLHLAAAPPDLAVPTARCRDPRRPDALDGWLRVTRRDSDDGVMDRGRRLRLTFRLVGGPILAAGAIADFLAYRETGTHRSGSPSSSRSVAP